MEMALGNSLGNVKQFVRVISLLSATGADRGAPKPKLGRRVFNRVPLNAAVLALVPIRERWGGLMKIHDSYSSGKPDVLMAAGSAHAPYPTPARPSPGESAVGARDARRNPELSLAWQIMVYVTLMASILASRFVDFFRAAVPWSPFEDWKYIIFAAIVSLLAFPLVYRKAQRTRNDPILVQLGLIFTAGMGSEKILSTVADLAKAHQ